jgi:hypothetical protein
MMTDRLWQIWSEGYRATGGESDATYRASVYAATFRQACDRFFGGDKYYDPDTLTYWGCHLYDNEADARKSFG